jgi:hypothetical protein
MKRPATITHEYGPFAGIDSVHGVSYDGAHVWFGSGDKLHALDPAIGEPVRSLDVCADAGTAFDGQHLYQLSGDRILKIEPESGAVLGDIAAPGPSQSGLAWAEARFGSGSIATVRCTRSTRRRERCFEPSSRIASLPASRGPTASYGMARGKRRKAS